MLFPTGLPPSSIFGESHNEENIYQIRKTCYETIIFSLYPSIFIYLQKSPKQFYVFHFEYFRKLLRSQGTAKLFNSRTSSPKD